MQMPIIPAATVILECGLLHRAYIVRRIQTPTPLMLLTSVAEGLNLHPKHQSAVYLTSVLSPSPALLLTRLGLDPDVCTLSTWPLSICDPFFPTLFSFLSIQSSLHYHCEPDCDDVSCSTHQSAWCMFNSPCLTDNIQSRVYTASFAFFEALWEVRWKRMILLAHS
ncbi:hypothetical protein BO94DRAFT_37821 [Aspergillus sclerotioniger CBS 115572]|uniref:Uncharacterized protein n=1 Tax=Aspergillus sclerotioniger CBS 115572 TaxID=1450535 RepID=A0A317WTR7_9EURO|nr:hypothetical protein BO94DRAFT_37821 [Aspergillus sclerotioniger CBS 115572]PWY89485.1 hypothetical protein BO94DRAFT_37821 [Aspergillus sclerotioniger CBS 115572]